MRRDHPQRRLKDRPVRTGREVAVFVHRRDELLLLRRTRDGIWHIPAGTVEPGETFRGAAARELEEETGLHVDATHLLDLEVGQHYPPIGVGYPAEVRDVELQNFATVAPPAWRPELDGEHTAFRWCAFDAALAELHWDQTRAAFDALRSRLASAELVGLDGRRLELWSRIDERIREAREVIQRVEPVSWEQRTTAEGWPVALVACHITLGLRRQAKWVELVVKGRPPHLFDWERTHALNALVARRVLRPESAEVLRALDAGLERWRRLLGRMTDADLSMAAFRQNERSSSIEWIAGALVPRHIEQHVRSIRSALT